LNKYYQSINNMIFYQGVSFIPRWMATRNIILATIVTGFILCIWTWTVQHSENPLIAYQTAPRSSAPPPRHHDAPSPSPKKPPTIEPSPKKPTPTDWIAGFLAAAGAVGAFFGASALMATGVTAGTLAGGTILVTAVPATAALAVSVVIFIAIRAVFGAP
jgi:hypothetical protein